MFEFIPVFKKRIISKLPKPPSPPKNPGNISWRVDPITGSKSPTPGLTRRFPAPSKELPLNRILPGPSLFPNFTDYQIAFDEKKKNPINSVKSSWSSSRRSVSNKMKCWVSFLTTPTADTPGTTLLLHFDAKRYLIGSLAEGTQRAAVQRRSGLIKVSDIFLTGPIRWSTTGGLLGMILTLADSTGSAKEDQLNNMKAKGKKMESEKQWLNVHGGQNLTHTLATARQFVFRKGMPVHTQEFRVEKDEPAQEIPPTWKDDYLKVWAMVLEPETEKTTRKRSHDDFTSDTPSSTVGNKGITIYEDDQSDQMRKAVVAEMFDSDWRLDTLVTKKLSEVAMPAQVFVRDDQGKIQKYVGPLVGEQPDVPDINVLVRNPWPGALIEKLPPTAPVINSVSYIFKNYPQRGKFDPQAAIKLGVKPGPHFRKLTLGESVTTGDGKIITPDQVLSPGKEGGGFAVIDLPDISYVKAAVERKEWLSEKVMNGIGAVFWILGPGVVDDPTIQNFMKNHNGLKHIVSSKDTCSDHLALESCASAAIRLCILDSERFPVPAHSNFVSGREAKESLPLPYEKARVGKVLQLEPKIEIQDDKIIPYLNTAQVVKESDPQVKILADEARKITGSEEYLAKLAELQKDIPSKDAEVFSLGTGSASPSKYRNVSSTLLRVPGYGSYLFDCGENTLGQMKRVLGGDLPEVLRDLKMVWISHLHADHHLGTASVVRAWNEETRDRDSTRNNKLIIASDEGMINWLREYSDVEDLGYNRVENITLSGHHRNLSKTFEAAETEKCGLTSIQACRVEHCKGALAVVIDFPNGFKVAYSGDCRPSDVFARLGRGATLLIHEATFDDELQGDAYAKKHSTTAEALEVGRRMGARRILLTHFSQRYQKVPVMESADGQDQVAIVAFDYMRVKIGDFAKVEHFKPALKKLYEESEAGEDS